MSLQWSIIAWCLYAELLMCTLLILPFISPQRWQKVFRSRLVSAIQRHINIYYSIFFVVLVVVFLDSIREVNKLSSTEIVEEAKHNPVAENTLHMKLFRAQRNFYIAGFCLFLYFVIRKLAILLSRQALLLAECEASKKQAESATAAAKLFLEDKDKQKTPADGKTDEKAKDDGSLVKKLKEELEVSQKETAKLTEELRRSQQSVDAMKKQSDGLRTEYDRLSEEHARLQRKFDQQGGSSSDKKSD